MRFIQVGRFLICRGLMSQVFSSRGVEQPGSSSGSKPEGRWFKSSPRNQFFAAAVSYRVYVIRSRDGKFYIGLSDNVHHRVKSTQCELVQLNTQKETLDIDMAKRRDMSIRSTET